jgi:hypothetical protein
MRVELLAQPFTEQTCLQELQRLQNRDGGWGFAASSESRVEPTAWALLALQENSASEATLACLNQGLGFLSATQLDAGGWAAVPGDKEGCWVTSIACWALQPHERFSENFSRGLQWLNDDRPRDSGFLWRIAGKLTSRNTVNAQNHSLSGWSWTPRTASWVEPTAFALIVHQLENANPKSSTVLRRRQIAEAMLYDRICPGGGWNCGNPRVYGVAGQPQIGPTVWALIALREYSQRAENQLSLGWLESIWDTINTPESLSLAIIAMRAYGRRNSAFEERLHSLYESTPLQWNVQALAWTALAMSEASSWLSTRDKNR